MRTSAKLWFERTAEAAVYLVLAAGVLLGGLSQTYLAGGPWDRCEWSLFAAAACAVGVLAAVLARPSDARMLALPAAFFVALAAIHLVQLVPLPEWFPTGRMALERRLGVAELLDAGARPASVDPSATLDSLVLLAACFSAAMAGMIILSRRPRFIRLAAVLAAVALASAALGATGAVEKTVLMSGRLSGTYVNPNRFCDLLCLALGGAVAAAMLLGGRWVDALPGGPFARLAGRRETRWAFVAAAVALQLCIVATLSRIGILSALVAGAAAAALAGSRLSLKRRLLGVIGVTLVVALVNASLVMERATARFSTLYEPGELGSGRLGCWRASLGLWADFPILGSGAGTFRHAFAAYQPPSLPGQFTYPHSELVGVLADMGLVGGAVVALAVGALGLVLLRALAESGHGSRRAVPGLFFALGAVALHSLADFGLREPATAFAFVLLAGAAWRLARNEPDEPEVRDLRGWIVLKAAVVASLGVAALWCALSAAAGSELKGEPPDVGVFEDEPVGVEAAAMSRALRLLPRLPEARLRLARTWWMRSARAASPGESGKALELAREHLLASIAVRPVDAKALYLLAVTEYALGSGPEADRAAIAASRAAPAYPAVQIAAARLLLERLGAEALSGEVEAVRRLRADAMSCLVRFAASPDTSVREALILAAESGANEPELRTVASAAGTKGELELARLLLGSGHAAEAAALVKSLRGRERLSREASAQAEMILGTALLVTSDVSGACDAFRRQLEAAGVEGFAAALVLQRRAFEKAGCKAEALAYLMSIEGSRRDVPALLAAIAEAAQAVGEVELAISYYERTLELAPGYAGASRLAALLVAKGDLQSALAVYRRIVARSPHDELARLAYARALSRADQDAEALREIEILRGGALAEEAERLASEITARRGAPGK